MPGPVVQHGAQLVVITVIVIGEYARRLHAQPLVLDGVVFVVMGAWTVGELLTCR